MDQPRNRLQESRLSGAVGSYKCNNSSLFYSNGYIPEGLDITVRDVYSFNFKKLVRQGMPRLL